MGKFDPAEAVKRIYHEGLGTVPYAAFMRCFNQLFEDPVGLKPREPSKELYGTFEAVCMGVEAGIRDEMGREQQRKEEFYAHLYPLWKEKLPEADFRRFQMVLDGTLREQLTQEHKEREERFRKAEDALSAALRQADTKGGRGRAAPARAEVPEEEELPISEEERATAETVRVFDSVDGAAEGIASGELPIRYLSRDQKRTQAAYLLEGKTVSVRLVEAQGAYYVILIYPSKHRQSEQLAARLRKCMEGRAFRMLGDYSSVKREGGHTWRVSLLKGLTTVALKSAEPLGKESVADTLKRLHSLLEVIAEQALKEP